MDGNMYRFVVHKSLNNTLIEKLNEDPVRPWLSPEERFANNREVVTLNYGDEIVAVCCIAYLDYVPAHEEEVFYDDNRIHDVACLYTIWSNKKGAGGELVAEIKKYLKHRFIKAIVTLSPKTDMAKNFHYKNGAYIYRENEHTINYKYEQ